MLGQYSLPFLAFCILALLVWSLLAERRQDKREEKARKADATRERLSQRPERKVSTKR